MDVGEMTYANHRRAKSDTEMLQTSRPLEWFECEHLSSIKEIPSGSPRFGNDISSDSLNLPNLPGWRPNLTPQGSMEFLRMNSGASNNSVQDTPVFTNLNSNSNMFQQGASNSNVVPNQSPQAQADLSFLRLNSGTSSIFRTNSAKSDEGERSIFSSFRRSSTTDTGLLDILIDKIDREENIPLDTDMPDVHTQQQLPNVNVMQRHFENGFLLHNGANLNPNVNASVPEYLHKRKLNLHRRGSSDPQLQRPRRGLHISAYNVETQNDFAAEELAIIHEHKQMKLNEFLYERKFQNEAPTITAQPNIVSPHGSWTTTTFTSKSQGSSSDGSLNLMNGQGNRDGGIIHMQQLISVPLQPLGNPSSVVSPRHRRVQSNESDMSIYDEDGINLGKNNRGNYRCGRCGGPKRKHVCQFVADTATREVDVQVDRELTLATGLEMGTRIGIPTAPTLPPAPYRVMTATVKINKRVEGNANVNTKKHELGTPTQSIKGA